MDFNEALVYAKENRQLLIDHQKFITGVGYFPGEKDGVFYFFTLSFMVEGKNDWFDLWMSGGYLFDSCGVEDNVGSETVEDLKVAIEEDGWNLSGVKFRVSNKNINHGLISAYGLKEYFPELPKPEDCLNEAEAREAFREKALNFIEKN